MQTSQALTSAGCRLNQAVETVGQARSVDHNEGSMTVVLKPGSKSDHIVHVTGPFRAPVSRVLRHRVHALLRRGQRRIVLDLSGISRIDAAGVGELIRTFNMTTAVNGAMRVVNATAWVREMLERAQLFELLGGETVAQRLV